MNDETLEKMTSSKSEHWCTPVHIAVAIKHVNEIALDPCSNFYSAVDAKKTVNPPKDGLTVNWKKTAQQYGGLVYVNPPYGRKVSLWIEKCTEEAEKGAEIISLTAARTETKWFHNMILPTAQAVCFIKGRLKFTNGLTGKLDNPALFPSVLTYWGENVEHFQDVFARYGAVWLLS